ncbi:MAG: hypothetical protein K940chlam9_01976, partial [Chlamydiae bacterium]|nr:hypothetical protein [Chlamydiota bacterium]
ETKAIASLVKKLKRLPNPPLVLLTTLTETGHIEGKKSAPEADWHAFLPFDFPYLVSPLVKRVSPDVFLLMETDFWPHLLHTAKKEGATISLLNGKISERSFKRFSSLSAFSRFFFSPFDHFFLQGPLYQKRFLSLGIPQEKLHITGNIKLDFSQYPPPDELLKEKLQLGTSPLLTLGSTHDPEEAIWIEALKVLWKIFPDLKVLLVPRHPERFSEVADLLTSKEVSFGRFSEGATFQDVNLLLVDAMGILRSCYSISTLTFVGGTFTEKVGGHNILEPCFYGKPVLYGPYLHSQPDLYLLSEQYGAGIKISPEEIVPTLKNLLENPEKARELGEKGKELATKEGGALDRTWEALAVNRDV